jgi:hypothetical protein
MLQIDYIIARGVVSMNKYGPFTELPPWTGFDRYGCLALFQRNKSARLAHLDDAIF